MKTEFQGVGSYEYKCDDPECFFCEKFGMGGVKRIPIKARLVYKRQINVKQAGWSKIETEKLRELLDLGAMQIRFFFPGRTIQSISDEQH